MVQDPNWLRHQPTEGFPSGETGRKIEALESLRRKIRLARNDYRTAPDPGKEVALRSLIQREAELSADVGFGANPAPQHGGPKAFSG